MLTNGMAEAKAEMEASQDDGGMGSLGNVFGQPDVLQKIAANPQTAAFLADPGFVAKIQSLQRNPSAIGQHLQDQRVLQVMGMLMGVNIVAQTSKTTEVRVVGHHHTRAVGTDISLNWQPIRALPPGTPIKGPPSPSALSLHHPSPSTLPPLSLLPGAGQPAW